ncbi:MAG TPA: tryptophan synthase subunit alpha [Acidobacteriota bacterium]|nr:tryptophan synthase subunit alpha [Acidobacteriota bacterium]HQF86194.1 tryptophan synthase subunit alpha [Acidobacteriota bacterium]HQG90562.1 tryptophan synthase subunit alpha [Acidobacteriota bacterium]HQK86218.1 tryptophan synthase subunit alpha [Acidobacteriota bacterium]
MNLTQRLHDCRQTGRLAFMAHVYAGYPDAAFTRRLIDVLAPAVDILELGIPYSDPLADGPVFQAACRRALENGVRPADVFRLAARLWLSGFRRPVVLTTYANMVYQAGPADFTARLAEVGVQGLIVPDLPVDESGELHRTCADAGVHLIQLVAPTTPLARLERILAAASGFVYLVSVAGVTGTDQAADTALQQQVDRIRMRSDLPLLVGFGISSPEQAMALQDVDGFIMGSAIARRVAPDRPADEALADVAGFVRQFRDLPRRDGNGDGGKA